MTMWHQLSVDDVLDRLKTHAAHGLRSDEAMLRMTTQGFNELAEYGRKSSWRMGWEQLTSMMVVVLMVAAGASVLLGDYRDAVAILIIVVLNALLGFSQEYRTERAMAALIAACS
jgi:Ca2+-transporting ATPase